MSDSLTVHDPDELRERRIGAGLNQDDLAKRTGLHQTYISALERGARQPTGKTLKRLADALGCEPVDLMRSRGRRSPKIAPRSAAGVGARRAA
jgi:transcriptional regulator with XRE-family HTH domain